MATETLIERETIIAELDAAVAGAKAGQGTAVILEGAPGIGKTSLLAGAINHGRQLGLTVHATRGGELEQALAWGVARDLLAPPARGMAEELLPAAAAALGLSTNGSRTDDPLAVSYALTDICGELAASRPMLLVVDDAHWADVLSVGWLAHLARRLTELPISLLIAARPFDPRRPAQLAVLAGCDGVRAARIAPLSVDGTSMLVRRVIADADDELCRECHVASGGNAFLVVELARELAGRQSRPTPADIADVAIDRIDRMVTRRLLASGTPGARLARAAAVCGSHAQTADVVAVAALDPDIATAAADALRAADVLDAGADQFVFAHPLLRSAVERAIPPGERTRLHLAAARQLDRHGEPIERVAAHLLAAEPGSDPWVRRMLISAGDSILSAGAPRAAMVMYQRALAERTGLNPDLLAALGNAAVRVDPAAAEAPLRAALGAIADPTQRTPVALDLALAFQTMHRPGEAVSLLDDLLSELAGVGAPRSARLRVEAELLAHSFFDLRSRSEWAARLANAAAQLTGKDDEEALIVVQLGIAALNTGTVEKVRRLAEFAWADGQLNRLGISPVSSTVQWIAYFHLYIDEPDSSLSLADVWADDARKQGSAVLACFAETIRAEALRRRGDLLDARAAADVSWGIASEFGRGFPGWWIAIGAVVQSLVSTGEPSDAIALLDREELLTGPPPEIMLLPLPRAVRGEALVAAGHLERGVTELLATWDWLDVQGEPSPGAWHFPATLVDGLLALGRRDEAAAVGRSWLERTETFGARTTIGMAQRAVALTETGDTQIEGLRRAEVHLAASPSKVEHARALLELGAALRRAGQRSASRPPLRQALDQAIRCGAKPIAERARDELAASGARPRRSALSGVDALTPSERRVAQLVAQGLTNREVASALFVSRKTVEHQLGSVYAKLGTNDRTQLGALIEGGDRP